MKTKTFRWYHSDWKSLDAEIASWTEKNPDIRILSHSIGGNGDKSKMYSQIVYEDKIILGS